MIASSKTFTNKIIYINDTNYNMTKLTIIFINLPTLNIIVVKNIHIITARF